VCIPIMKLESRIGDNLICYMVVTEQAEAETQSEKKESDIS